MREHDLLVFLLPHPRQAFSREELLKHVWGWEYAHSTVMAQMRRLREKVELDPRNPIPVVTVFDVGHRYELEDDLETVRRHHTGPHREADRLAGMVETCSSCPASTRRRFAGGLPSVEGSLPELGRVLRNLLSNAIRYTSADGVMLVRASSDGDPAYVEVADACGGIPASDLARVFEVAFRGTAAPTPGDDGGAGLGLANARGLVEAHHGEISISNRGPGCRVLVRLPAARLPLATG